MAASSDSDTADADTPEAVTDRASGADTAGEGLVTALSDAQVRAEAALLDAAERERVQVRQSTGVYPNMSIEDAYRVQNAWRLLREARGETVIGHKIGLTSRAMQAAMSIDTPDSGFLTDSMALRPDEPVTAADYCDPRLEVELAFVLAQDLGGEDLGGEDLSVEEVLDATERVVAAVELIAARSFRSDPATGRTRTVVDTIADNAADAGVITAHSAVGPRDLDLRWVGAIAWRNDSVEETGLAAGVLGHPANGIVWLARRYAQQGLTLRAGQIILSGSFTRPIPMSAGDFFRFDFGPLGSFTLPVT